MDEDASECILFNFKDFNFKNIIVQRGKTTRQPWLVRQERKAAFMWTGFICCLQFSRRRETQKGAINRKKIINKDKQ